MKNFPFIIGDDPYEETIFLYFEEAVNCNAWCASKGFHNKEDAALEVFEDVTPSNLQHSRFNP
ncbi:hypothetical protein AMATHDRAFT_11490 [Amanita thiersii Skay4041]|uniref:Uncharacterized protein n=1 Tax=Amanita thiersii Skay4041 TaxID=703135 RepID=A0A2A9N6E5_9AGAR|nr:hypothetical protein AMATHDRAFT_11490 [Amanita thiersii Skay4041]